MIGPSRQAAPPDRPHWRAAYHGSFQPIPCGGSPRQGVALIFQKPPAGCLVQVRSAGADKVDPGPWKTLPLPKGPAEESRRILELFLPFDEAEKVGIRTPSPGAQPARGGGYEARLVMRGLPSCSQSFRISLGSIDTDRMAIPRGEVQRLAVSGEALPERYLHRPTVAWEPPSTVVARSGRRKPRVADDFG